MLTSILVMILNDIEYNDSNIIINDIINDSNIIIYINFFQLQSSNVIYF